jgi:hypothetical protein
MSQGLQNSGTTKKSDYLKNSNLYNQNKKELGFLPALFMVVMFVCAGLLGFWFVKTAGFSKSIFSNNQSQSTALIDLVNKNDNVETISNIRPTQTIDSSNSKSVKIFVDAKQDCNLVLGSPDEISAPEKIQKDNSGWWVVKGDCADQNLIGLEIFQLTAEEYQNYKNKLGQQNLQILDPQNSLYAAVYTKNQAPTIYNFRTYIKYLVEPVFTDMVYLRAENIVDTKHVDSYTYYLEGGCRSGENKSCNLWRVNNFSGVLEFLSQDVAQTNIGQQNELKGSQQIKFAKNQDIQNALNLIIVNWKNQYPDYKLITLDSNQWNIIQAFTIYPAQNMYFDYFR